MTSPIDHTDTHVPDPQALRLAKLFDLRTFMGALFLIFVLVFSIEGLRASPPQNAKPEGLRASPAKIAKAVGINISLWTGAWMVVNRLMNLLWMLVRPPSLGVKHE